MADNDDVSGAPDADATPTERTRAVLPPDPAAASSPASSQPVLVTRWRDRAWSFRAMIAVALASLLVGGLAGGAIVAVSDDDHDRGQFRMGPGADRMPPGWRGHGPRRFGGDGGPKWHWGDGPQPPDGNTTPDGTPSPPTPSPSE